MAVTTITTTAPQDVRIAAAVGRRQRLKDVGGVPRSATQAECKAWIIADLTLLVVEEEAAAAREALVPASPITPT